MSTTINENAVEPIQNTIDTLYKMNCNMSLYKYDDVGTNIPMFIKNFKLTNYIYGETTYTIKEADINRLDVISYKAYNTPELFWVIMLINNIIDPFDIPVGTVLRLIPKEYIVANILQIKNTEDDLF